MSASSSNRNRPYQIVVGFDFSELADRALEEALEIASRRQPSELHVVTVAQPDGTLVRLPGSEGAVTEEVARDVVRNRVAVITEQFQASRGAIGLERVAVYVLTGVPAGEPAKLITDLSESVEADLIVVGTHGRTGLRRLALGSVAARVVRRATASVLVVRPLDFVKGKKVPAIERPLGEGEPHLKKFEHRRTYHYVDRIPGWTHRTMPAS